MEELEVAGMQAVTAGLDEFPGHLGALLEIPLVVVGIGRDGLQEDIPCVILAEGAFEQADLGFQGHCGPLGNLVCALVDREVVDGEVYVLEHLPEYEFTDFISMSCTLLDGRTKAQAPMSPVSSSQANRTFSISCSGLMSTVIP